MHGAWPAPLRHVRGGATHRSLGQASSPRRAGPGLAPGSAVSGRWPVLLRRAREGAARRWQRAQPAGSPSSGARWSHTTCGAHCRRPGRRARRSRRVWAKSLDSRVHVHGRDRAQRRRAASPNARASSAVSETGHAGLPRLKRVRVSMTGGARDGGAVQGYSRSGRARTQTDASASGTAPSAVSTSTTPTTRTATARHARTCCHSPRRIIVESGGAWRSPAARNWGRRISRPPTLNAKNSAKTDGTGRDWGQGEFVDQG